MDILKGTVIILLSITTIIFAALFLTYYNNVDKFMKDKEIGLIKREIDLSAREKNLRDCEKCMNNETELHKIIDSIKELALKGSQL